jgi:hypothetical protein
VLKQRPGVSCPGAFIFLAASLALLGACQTTVAPSEDSPYYAVPVGSRLVLNRALTIPPERASVYIQRGQIVPFTTLDDYDPHCRFELLTVRPRPQTVEPDEFVVHKVRQEIVVSRAFTRPGLLLALGGDDDGDGPDSKLYSRILNLRSAKQPEVLRIACMRWHRLAFSRHLTIREIRDTLSELFTLKLAAPPG